MSRERNVEKREDVCDSGVVTHSNSSQTVNEIMGSMDLQRLDCVLMYLIGYL